MKINENIISQLRPRLINAFPDFLKSSIEYLTNNFDTYSRVSFENMLKKEPPYELNLSECLAFMSNSIADIDQLNIKAMGRNENNFSDNVIYFPFTSRFPEITEWGTDKFWQYRHLRDDLDYACEEAFYMHEVNQEKYEPFKALNIFNDVVFESELLSKYEKKRDSLYNKKAWLNYLEDLLKLYFSEFKFSKELSSKTHKRHVLELSKDISFGFEYHEIDVQYELRKGTPIFPRAFNLVLIHQHSGTPEVLNLGILGNPFFHPPCYPLTGFSAVDIDRKYKEGNPYRNNIVKVDEKHHQIIHSKLYGANMKKHGLFYMDLLAATSQPYINYLRKVLEEIFGDK